MTSYLLAAGISLLVSLLAVPPTISLARAFGLLDAPDSVRRLHSLAVPRLGGLAVWTGAVAGLVALLAIPSMLPELSLGQFTETQERLGAGFAGGLLVMVVIGLVDDVRGLRPRHKLAAQIVAAIIVTAAGFRIDGIALPGAGSIGLGWLAVPASLLWIVGVTNAFNLIDGLDGLAGGVALVGLATLSVASVLLNSYLVLAIAIPLAGGVIGFLRFNTARPSRIFLGDIGSLSIGFALAVLTVEGSRRSDGNIVAIVPLFALAFPLLDTAIAMLRRWLRGVPLSGADGRHVHHQLVCLGLSRGRAAVAICLFSTCFAALGLSLAFAPPVVTLTLALLGGATAVLFLVHGLRWLGYHEFVEAQASFASGLFKARSVIRDRILAREFEVRIRNAGSPAALDAVLSDAVHVFGFERLILTDLGATEIDASVRMLGRRLLRLDCPLDVPSWTGGNGCVLRVWWCAASRRPPLYAERVLGVLVPAIEAAMSCFAPGSAAHVASHASAELATLSGSSVGVPTAARPRRAREAVQSR